MSANLVFAWSHVVFVYCMRVCPHVWEAYVPICAHVEPRGQGQESSSSTLHLFLTCIYLCIMYIINCIIFFCIPVYMCEGSQRGDNLRESILILHCVEPRTELRSAGLASSTLWFE